MLLALALDQGEAFAADAAAGTLLALVAIVVFMVVLAAASARFGTAVSLAAAWVAFLVGAVVVAGFEAGPLVAAACGAVALVAGARVLPHPPALGLSRPSPVWDLPLRAVAAATLVVAITAAADAAGPRLSGALALSPIAISVLTGFSLATQGRDPTLALLRGLVLGLPAVLVFFTIVALAVEPWGTAPAFVVATVVVLIQQTVVVLVTGPGGAAASPTTPPGTGESHPTHSA
ncbi:MAG: hypothetical protein JHC95_13570 [Solirubrobacteraceae bacterium]|nr:hypothetical protein [Solirubrobacteraceae bacterium]